MEKIIAEPVTMRTKFDDNQIGRLPKPTAKQTEEVKQDYKKGIRCKECGAWHHPDVVHLDYVGHAALTDRLLDVDPSWHWEPLAYDENTTLCRLRRWDVDSPDSLGSDSLGLWRRTGEGRG